MGWNEYDLMKAIGSSAVTELEQLTHEPLHERAYRSLRSALRSGRFKPGQALTIRGLAGQLGISATPVREAMQRLIAEQALQMLSNRTVIVPVLTRERFAEITKIRLRLECLAAQEAVPNITDATLAALERHEAAMAEALGQEDFSAYLEHNERFHFALYECSGMPFLILMIELAWLQVGPGFNMLADEGRYRDVATCFHDDVINLVAARDAEGVAHAIRQDISEAARHLSKHLTFNGDSPATSGGIAV
jgi:DNA-binding GntR family transcriptional regulator